MGVERQWVNPGVWRGAGELAGAMSYLLELSALEAGRPCPASRLPPAERAIAGHLVQLGLLRPFRCVLQQTEGSRNLEEPETLFLVQNRCNGSKRDLP